MSDLRLAFAGTAIASLAWDENHEKPVDRVASSARVNDLGRDLWKLRYQGATSSAKACYGALKRLLATRYPSENEYNLHAIILECLFEYSENVCETCKGKRSVQIEKLVHVCATCDGTGVRRHSDVQRAMRMGISLQKVRLLNHKIGWLLGEINAIDREVNFKMNVQLER